jgi:electron-transferring-flavoprotein dehydrogenase
MSGDALNNGAMTGEVAGEGETAQEPERATMEVDIACVGFGPAMGGFLTTLTKEWTEHPDDPAFMSKVAPGMPLQVLCYERADDLAAGVSGVVTSARGIRASLPELDSAEIPMAAPVTGERVLYLLDPIGASRRSFALRAGDAILRGLGGLLGVKDSAYELPWTPAFLHKHGGLLLSMGQFNQWVGAQVMATGLVQIWPGTPVSEPIFYSEPCAGLRPCGGGDPCASANKKCFSVRGIRLADQGVDKTGAPADGFMAGMDVLAPLTVVGDGPVGAIGQALNQRIGMPPGNAQSEWALGMKMVIELPEDTPLKVGTVWHTFGFPEPEIFGFLYVHPDHIASVGIFVPSWMGDSQRTAYRYLQHYIQHPALWPYLKDGTLRSWGAKSLQESGKNGEPFLTGDGFARIGEGSGSTNMLTNSGVDEAWTTGVQLAEAVVELLRADKPFTQVNLSATYEARRRASVIEREGEEAKNARNGFHKGLVRGMIGMALAGLTGGKLSFGGRIPTAQEQIRPLSLHRVGIALKEAEQLAAQTRDLGGRPLHDALMTARGWPEIELDGRLLVTQQDALLIGGKVQAMAGFADHVAFRNPEICKTCGERTCIAMCSGQAITQGADNTINFEREKCVHCGACLWNCAQAVGDGRGNLEFRAGAGGLHSAEN